MRIRPNPFAAQVRYDLAICGLCWLAKPRTYPDVVRVALPPERRPAAVDLDFIIVQPITRDTMDSMTSNGLNGEQPAPFRFP